MNRRKCCSICRTQRARFTKQGKLAQSHKSTDKSYAGDLLFISHYDQCNLPRAAQMTITDTSSAKWDTSFFGGVLNNGTNTAI